MARRLPCLAAALAWIFWCGAGVISAAEPIRRLHWLTQTQPLVVLVDAAADELLADQGEPVEPLPPPPAPVDTGKSVLLEGNGSRQDEQASKDDDKNHAPTNAFVMSYLPGSGDGLGLFGFDFRSSHGPRYPEVATLAMTTGWGITWLTGPQSTDLPPQLYHVVIDIGGIANKSEPEDEWIVDLAITPGWFTDWENRRPESFRLAGRASAYYRLDEETALGGGFVYLRRDDIPALPIVGVILGNERVGYRHELVFPRPRMSWRVRERSDSSRWLYVLGELGGGSWAIKRTDRTPDVVTLRDLHVMAGIEFRQKDGGRAMWEAGWVFDRSVTSRTGRGDYNPSDAFQIRCWFEY